MRGLKFLLVGALLAFSGLTLAGQSANLVCVKYKIIGLGGNSIGNNVGMAGMGGIGANSNVDVGAVDNCAVYELHVNVFADSDVGRSGGFGIGAQVNGGQMAYWTAAGGWGGFTGGFVPVADGYYAALPVSRDFVVYKGPLESMCSLSRGRDFKVYAAHGALMPEREAVVQAFAATKSTVSSDHIRKLYIQMDATARNGGKWGVVFEHHCTAGMGFMGGF